MPFGMEDRVDPMSHVLDEGPYPPKIRDNFGGMERRSVTCGRLGENVPATWPLPKLLCVICRFSSHHPVYGVR